MASYTFLDAEQPSFTPHKKCNRTKRKLVQRDNITVLVVFHEGPHQFFDLMAMPITTENQKTKFQLFKFSTISIISGQTSEKVLMAKLLSIHGPLQVNKITF